MTPEERADALIGRIAPNTSTDDLRRMIAEEIGAAVEARDASAAARPSVALEHPRPVGVAFVGRPEGPPDFRVVRHPAFDNFGGRRLGEDWQLRCCMCGADKPAPGKTVLHLMTDGYHCEACVYDEYVEMKTHSLSLFPVQYHTKGEIEDALLGELYWEDDAVPDYELLGRLTEEIFESIKTSEFLKPLPDLVSTLMREVYYRTLHRHRDELPAGYSPPSSDLAP